MRRIALVLSFGMLMASMSHFSEAAECSCADTGVCVLPAGECDSIGSPVRTPLAGIVGRKHKVIRQDAWYGGRRTVFDFEGYEAWIVEPPEGVAAKDGKPWTWTMQWKTAFVPRTGVPALLKQGWHHATIDTFKHRMDEAGLSVSAAFQAYLVNDLELAKKTNLIGLSWGGFFSTRYAAHYPQNVAKIYLDCPLLNFDGRCGRAEDKEEIGSWAGSGSGNWTDDPRMPINLVKSIADAKIPVLLSYGDADTVLNPKLNAELFVSRFRAAGGDLRVVRHLLYGHHPHGFEPGDETIPVFFSSGEWPRISR